MLRKGPPIDLTALTTVSTAATVVLAAALGYLVDVWRSRATWRSIVWPFAPMSIGWVSFFLVWAIAGGALDPSLTIPLAAVGGLAAVLVATPARVSGLSLRRTYPVVAVWALVVFSPITIVAFTTVSGFFATGYVPLDLAGAFPGLVAAGASTAAFLLTRRPIMPSTQRAPEPRTRALVVTLAAMVWALWLVWMLGLELAITTATPRILVNGLLAPAAAVVVWLVVERIRYARTTFSGALLGLFCGLAAIAPAGGYIDTIGAIVTGAFAGVVCSLLGYSLAERRGTQLWLPTVVLLVGGTVGAVLVGVFAIRSGIVVTGQPETLLSQLASAGLTIGWSFAVSLGLWSIAARRHRPSPVDVQ